MDDRYIRREAWIAASINGCFSALFVLLAFGLPSSIGVHRLILDAIPQSLIVALMSCLVPMYLARQRSLFVSSGYSFGFIVRRSLVVVCVASMIGFLMQAALLSVTGPMWPLASVLVMKVTSGALLGGCCSAVALRQLRRIGGR